VARRIAIALAALGCAAVVLAPTPVAAATTITFENLDHDTVVTNQYPGVAFNEARIVECSQDPSGCATAFSGTRALRPDIDFEFDNERLIMVFDTLQETVSMRVSSALGAHTITVDAFRGGALVDSDTGSVNASWLAFSVSAAAGIDRVQIRGVANNTSSEDNQFAIDDLFFDEVVGVTTTTSAPDTTPPVITILTPEDGASLFGSDPRVSLTYEVRDDGDLALVEEAVWFEAADGSRGAEVYDARYPGCDNTLECFPPYRGSETVFLPELGRYHVGVIARDAAGNVAVASVRVSFDEPVDVWVMGLEWNQAVQDVVYTDLGRPAGDPGSTTVASGASRVPVVPGQPMAVRGYIGLRRPTFVEVPPEGLPVTGTLFVDITSGGATRSLVLDPVVNPACANHEGEDDGGGCVDPILVPLGYGRPVHLRDPSQALIDPYYDWEIESATDYDIDLIWRRAIPDRTLNFVVPGEELEGLRPGDRVALRLEVEPVGYAEEQPGDNTYTMNIDDVAPAVDLPLRVVTVAVPRPTGIPATTAQVDRTIEEMLKLMPYAGSDERRSTYVWGGGFIRIRIEILFGLITEEIVLDHCNSLFVNLLLDFGVDPGRTLLALAPPGFQMMEADGDPDCTGIGWKLPAPGGAYMGGIAHTRTADGGDFWNEVAVAAQELYHAHLDRRHVGDFHGEREGCVFDDDPAVEIAGFLLFGLILDTDCTKPAPYPHGALGSYPLPTGPLRGDIGAVGMRIEGDAAAGWALTIMEPCPGDPAVPLDRTDNYAWIDQRYTVRNTINHSCRVADNRRAHDFLSYGGDRWASVEQFSPLNLERPGPNPPALPDIRTFIAAGPAPESGMEFEDAPALRVWGLIDSEGRAGFGGSRPFDGTGHTFHGVPDGAEAFVDVEREDGTTLRVPGLVSIQSAHGQDIYGVLLVEVPPGPPVTRLTLMREGEAWTALEASDSPPSVEVMSPNGAERWSDGDLQIDWAASDPDGDALTFTVELSTDGGATWVPVGSTSEMSIALPAGAASPTDEAAVRVVASDGLRFAADVGDGTFCIGGEGLCSSTALETVASDGEEEEEEGEGGGGLGVLPIALILLALAAVGAGAFYVGRRESGSRADD